MRCPTDIETLYLDFDGFFANAEKTLRPHLQGRPVGVVPLASRHTSLIARYYSAKAYGINRGTSVEDAHKLCPDIVLRVARHDDYVRLHHEILAVVNAHVPIRKVWSVDEMECSLIGQERRNGVAIATAIKASLRAKFGPSLTCSVGLAPNQFLAKVGAEMNKPDGLVILRPQDLPGPLFKLGLTDLPGISAGMESRLHAAGIYAVEGLWHLSPKHARAIWGSVEGERMWAQLRGYSVTRPETTRRMFGHGRVLSSDWRMPHKARDCIRLLTAKAARRLRRENYTASALGISLSAQDGRRWAKDTRFFPARDDHTFLHAVTGFFDAGVSDLNGARLKKLSVVLHDISQVDAVAGDLFEQAGTRATRARWERLTDAMDDLNSRNGGCVVSLGFRREPPGGYAGAKIAFGRVPDLDDFAKPSADVRQQNRIKPQPGP